MKKIIYSLIIICSASALNAQTLTQANHAPAAFNKNFITTQCDSSITIGASGVGAVWNYSPILRTSITNTFVTSSASNASYPMADVSVSSGSANISYYKATSTGLNYYGGTISANGIPIMINYTNPAKFAQYPFTSVSSVTSTVSGNLTVFGNNGTFTGNCNVTADASGTLTVGTRVFTNVVRLKTIQLLNGTIPLAGSVNISQFNYDYYAPNSSKAPIFSITTSTVTSPLGTSSQTFVTVLKDYLTVSVNETAKADIELSVFPNPSNSIINFNTASLDATEVIVYDLQGKIVTTERFENGNIKMAVSHFTNAVYLYTVIGKNNQLLKSGRFTVAK